MRLAWVGLLGLVLGVRFWKTCTRLMIFTVRKVHVFLALLCCHWVDVWWRQQRALIIPCQYIARPWLAKCRPNFTSIYWKRNYWLSTDVLEPFQNVQCKVAIKLFCRICLMGCGLTENVAQGFDLEYIKEWMKCISTSAY